MFSRSNPVRSHQSVWRPLWIAALLCLAPSAGAQTSAVVLSSPADGARVNGTVILRAAATVDVTSVTFSFSGPTVIPPVTATTRPFSWDWNTTGLSGTYVVTVAPASGAMPPAHSASITVDWGIPANPPQPVAGPSDPGTVAILNTGLELSRTVVAGTVVRIPIRAANPRNREVTYSMVQTQGPAVAWASIDSASGVFRFATAKNDSTAGSFTFAVTVKELTTYTNPTWSSATANVTVQVLPRQNSDGPIIRVIEKNQAVNSQPDYKFLTVEEAIEVVRALNSQLFVDVERLNMGAATPDPTVARAMDPPAPPGLTVNAPTILAQTFPTNGFPYYGSGGNALYKRYRLRPFGDNYAPVTMASCTLSATETVTVNGTPTVFTSEAVVRMSVSNDFENLNYQNPMLDEHIHVMTKVNGASLWSTSAGTYGLQPKPLITIQGTVDLSCEFMKNNNALFSTSPSATNRIPDTIRVEYRANDVPISPACDPFVAYTWDTTTLASVLSPQVPTDVIALTAHVVHASSTDPSFDARWFDHRWHPRQLCVAVVGIDNDTSRIPAAPFSYESRETSNRFDSFAYGGNLPSPSGLASTFPTSPTLIPPASNPNDMLTASNWTLDPLVQATNKLYQPEPHLYRSVNGHPVAAWHIMSRPGSTSEASRLMHDYADFWGGPRGSSSVSPYATYIPSPWDRSWYAIDISGRFLKLWEDGSVTTIAGYVNHVSGNNQPPLLPMYWLFESQIAGLPTYNAAKSYRQNFLDDSKDLVGTFTVTTPLGTNNAAVFNTPNDVAADPNELGVFYVADSGNNRIAKVVLGSHLQGVVTTLVGDPVGSLGAGQVPAAGFADDLDGSANGLVASFNNPYSLAFGLDGKLYVADKGNKAIRRIDVSTLVVDTVLQTHGGVSRTTINAGWSGTAPVMWPTNSALGAGQVPVASAVLDSPTCIRRDSHGYLVFAEDGTRAVRRLNVGGGWVETVCWLGANSNPDWLWLDVDRNQMVGPLNDILIAQAVGFGSNTRFHRIPMEDATRTPTVFLGSAGANTFLTGPATAIVGDAKGHYPWAIAIDDEEPKVITSGYGTVGPIVARRKLSTEPSLTNDVARYTNGEFMMRWGTVRGFPRHSRPAFASLHGLTGHSRLGPSVVNFDDVVTSLGTSGDASIAAFVQGDPNTPGDGGMSGSVLRPEISGRDLVDLTYYIKRQTALGHTGPITIAPTSFETKAPEINNVAIYRVADAYLSPDPDPAYDDLIVTWHTPEPTVGCVALGQMECDYLGRFFDIENQAATVHSSIVRRVKSDRTYTITILARDAAGNMTKRRF